MTRSRLALARSHTLAVLLFVVVMPPGVTLMWLGLQLLEQDRSLLRQREFERRQAAAEAVTRSLEQSLAAAEHVLRQGTVPEGMARLSLSVDGVDAIPRDRVLWVPQPRATRAAKTTPFMELERSEFRGRAESALETYVTLARSADPTIRAGALLRVARVHRRQERWDAAVRAYRNLAAIGEVTIEGVPADLIARRALCAVLEESGNTNELQREAVALEHDVLAGRWPLDRASWDVTVADIVRWAGRPLRASSDRLPFSTVADTLWKEWRGDRAQPSAAIVRRVVSAAGLPITVLSVADTAGLIALAIAPSVVTTWIARATGGARDAHVTLLAPSGETLGAAPATAADATVRLSAADTGLPWTIVVAGADSTLSEEFDRRRRLLSAGLAAILLLLAGGSYFLWRLVQREMTVARLQTDFVSAVSHEFRTPLTSLGHVTELLEEDDEMSRERRRSFYGVLARNTARLQQLVESLLDFARMERHRKPYDLQPLQASELVQRVVADFQHDVAPLGYSIALHVDEAADLRLRADGASLTNALWNLLDNAVKYSPERRTIRVSVRPHPAGVAVAVEDDGLGIPKGEQKEIFQRFVRGKKASELGIQGTGLGLAIVSHIAHAHGGTVEVESREGAGSTFRLVLPVLS